MSCSLRKHRYTPAKHTFNPSSTLKHTANGWSQRRNKASQSTKTHQDSKAAFSHQSYFRRNHVNQQAVTNPQRLQIPTNGTVGTLRIELR